MLRAPDRRSAWRARLAGFGGIVGGARALLLRGHRRPGTAQPQPAAAAHVAERAIAEQEDEHSADPEAAEHHRQKREEAAAAPTAAAAEAEASAALPLIANIAAGPIAAKTHTALSLVTARQCFAKAQGCK